MAFVAIRQGDDFTASLAQPEIFCIDGKNQKRVPFRLG